MRKVLDLNTAKRPTLELVLQDKDRTKLRLSTPTEGLIEEMQQLSPDMLDIISSGSREGVEMIYDLAARLISCNRDFIKVTAKELTDKYNMDLESAILFFSAYMDFITEITKEKN